MTEEELPLDELTSLARSQNVDDRKRALAAMRAAYTSTHPEYLEIARGMIADVDNNCRWQATIVVGEFIQTHPAVVWEVVCEHGDSPDEDLRDAIATCLVEHLLEYHFDWVLPKLRKRITAGHRMLANTLRRSWPMGAAEARWSQFDQLLIDVGERDGPSIWTEELHG